MTLTPRPDHVPAERVVDFDIYAPPGVKADFHLGWKSLQVPGVPEIIWTPRNGGHWIPTRAVAINEVMSDYERFSSRVIMIPKTLGADHKLLPTTLDPPPHRPYRNILNEALTPKVVSRIETMILEIAINLIEKVRQDGRCNFTTAYAEIFPIQIFLTIRPAK